MNSFQASVDPRVQRTMLWLCLACACGLIACTFKITGSHAPRGLGSLNVVALTKLLSRLVTLAVVAYTIRRVWSDRSKRQMLVILPLGLFITWAFVSALWSPLKAVTLGQSLSFSVVWLLAITVAALWRDPGDSSIVLGTLSLCLLVYSSVMLLSFFAFPAGKPGRFAFPLAHPSTVGATASIGLLIVVASLTFWRWSWAAWLLLPSLVVHTAAMLLAMDRASIGILLGTMVPAIVLFAPRIVTALITLGVSCGGALYLFCDSGLELMEPLLRGTVATLRRGQSNQELLALSGREELWTIMWESYLQRPVIGHGYFVTSNTGALEVWRETANYTAHNTLFQVLVTTGIVGLLIFCLGFVPALFQLARHCIRGTACAYFGVFVALWTFGWGLTDSGITLQMLPPTVVVFCVWGCVAAELEAHADAVGNSQCDREVAA